jgi:hypothetical protein
MVKGIPQGGVTPIEIDSERRWFEINNALQGNQSGGGMISSELYTF